MTLVAAGVRLAAPGAAPARAGPAGAGGSLLRGRLAESQVEEERREYPVIAAGFLGGAEAGDDLVDPLDRHAGALGPHPGGRHAGRVQVQAVLRSKRGKE